MRAPDACEIPKEVALCCPIFRPNRNALTCLEFGILSISCQVFDGQASQTRIISKLKCKEVATSLISSTRFGRLEGDLKHGTMTDKSGSSLFT